MLFNYRKSLEFKILEQVSLKKDSYLKSRRLEDREPVSAILETLKQDK